MLAILGGTTTTYGYDDNNKLLTVNGSTSCSYDGNGNLTNSYANLPTKDMAYNDDNRLTQITYGGVTDYYFYTYTGLRYRATLAGTTYRYLYNGERVLEELNDSGTMQARYTTEDGSYYGAWLHLYRPSGTLSRFPMYDNIGTARGGDHHTSYFQVAFLQLVNWTYSASGVKERSGTVNSFTAAAFVGEGTGAAGGPSLGPSSTPAPESRARIICPKSSLLLALEAEIKKPDYALIARVGQPDAGMPTFRVALKEKPPSGKLRPVARALVEFLQSKLPSGEAMATFDVQGRDVLRARWRAASQRVVLEEVR